MFVGPSIPFALAQATLPQADFRGPIQRGDLDNVPAGALVAIIDGLFAQTLAISPGEIREAIARGVAVYGAASMGALRAAEIPEIVGVGRIYEMYRSGVIERDDEVAVLLNPDTHEPLTEPLVNVRHSVERLVRSGTLSRHDGEAIVESGIQLHYSERTYRGILAASRLANNKDIDDIIRLLKSFDLKRDDAQLLLETIRSAKAPSSAPPDRSSTYVPRAPDQHVRVNSRESATSSVLVWESGDEVAFEDLVRFLKITGAFDGAARRAIARMAIAGTPLMGNPPSAHESSPGQGASAQSLLDGTRARWGWESPEEAHVTMRDLGLGLEDVADSLEAEACVRAIVARFAASPTAAFHTALRAELWLDGLSLKRETLRLGALRFFAREGALLGAPTIEECREAQRSVARLQGLFRWGSVRASLEALGVPPTELDDAVSDVALARRAARATVDALDRRPPAGPPTARASRWHDSGLAIESCVKASGSARFSLDERDAQAKADAIAQQMGVVRVGLVGELDTLGVYIAQAFGQRSGWSSSFSSGKSETREGARVGSIMEEVEIYAQDAYRPREQVRASLLEASRSLPVVDPRELGLPFDTRYSPTLEIDWSPCVDLVSGAATYVPTAALLGERQFNDIFYCPRLGGKIFSSSGLGSGFSLAEAIVHAAAEYIERHAYRLAELELDNPGEVGVRRFWFVDDRGLPDGPARLIQKYRRAGACVRLMDITSEVRVPTFYARVFDDLFDGDRSVSSDGFACHPDPSVAATMALLEAAQTRGGYIAGGREDYSLHARSLGRHERPRTAVPRAQSFWFSNDRPQRELADTPGYHTTDIRTELEWIVDRVVAAGVTMFLVADYTIPAIQPAHAVRVLLPGLETTNPLFTGRRARATLIRDVLPRGSSTQ